jgi:serine/threonine-protein kinase
MSPEQARGKEVDKRTDIWAFGCILFEMLSGRRAFTGETISDALAAILTKEPEWTALPTETPARIRDLLGRCLQKDASKRLRDIGDARMEIERTLEGDRGQSRETSQPPHAFGWRRGAVAGLVLLILAGAASWLVKQQKSGIATETSPKSLVVLPVKILSDAPNGQLVGDGLADMLSARLYQVPGIQVVTPTAAVAASDKNKDPFGAARSVGGDLVFNSSLMQSGDRLRIIYSIWNVETRAQVDGDTVDGSASDIFGVQDKLVDRVAAGLKLPKPSRKTPTPSGLETASEQERYLQALGALQRYDQPASIDRALRILEALSRERPASPLVQAAYGRAALAKFNETRDSRWTDRASDAVARAQELAGGTTEVEVTVGELKLQTGQPQQAASAFEQALAAQPNSFDALLGLARAYDESGEFSRSEATYRRAIGLQPSYFGGYSKLGGFYFNHGRFREAADSFRRVTELTPDNAKAFSNLGGALLQFGRFDQALEAFRKSVALVPTDLAWSNIGTLEFYNGHYAAAAEAYEKALALQPNHYENWANLGDARRMLPGQEGGAAEAYERSIALSLKELETNPENAHVHSYFGLTLAKTGKIAEARQQTARSLKLVPRNPEFLYNAAVVAIRAQQRTEALANLREAIQAGYNPELIRRDPEFAGLRNERDFQQAIVTPRGSS